MKILKNNTLKKEDDKFPLKIVCEECGSELEVEESDIRIGYLGTCYVKCPVCNKDTYIYELDGVVVTKDTIKFPDYFYHFDNGKKLSNEEIEDYIRRGIEWHRRNPNSFVWDCGTGDSDIAVYNYSGDNEYRVVVSRGFYDCEIPFEEEDYDVQDEDSWENKGIKIKLDVED